MLSVLHISDLHFGPPLMAEVAESLLEIAPQMNPDIVVASGDFTQRARAEQFQQAREFLDALPDVPLVVTPGNHDVPLYRIFERLFSPYREYQRYISEQLNMVVRMPGAVFVALNSTAPHRAITNGRIHRTQLDFCSRAFADTDPADLRVVVAHHHFAPAPDYERTDVMPEARRAIDRFASLEVDMIMGGHLHRAYIGNSLDIYAGENRERGITIVQCGTSTSRRGRAREREKNSFNWIEIDDTTLTIWHYMYNDKASTFVPISRHVFPRNEYLMATPEMASVAL